MGTILWNLLRKLYINFITRFCILIINKVECTQNIALGWLKLTQITPVYLLWNNMSDHDSCTA